MFLSLEFPPTPNDLLLYPPGIKTIRQIEDDNVVVSHSDSRENIDIENLYRIKLEADEIPFDQVNITNLMNDQALFLVAIGYMYGVGESYKRAKRKIERFRDKAWPDDGNDDVPVVLSPRSCYRLFIQTAVNCDETHPETYVYYFRTDGPPAEFFKNYTALGSQKFHTRTTWI